MDLITALAAALAAGLFQVAGKLLEKGVLEPALKPANDLLEKWLQRGHRQAEKDAKLLKSVQKALESAGAPPADDQDRLLRWLQQGGLDCLAAEGNDALRRQVARGVLAYDDPEADPPRDLMVALRWPRSRRRELAALLAALRGQLAGLDDWRAPVEYADSAAERGLLRDLLEHLAQLDQVYVRTEAGQALRVAVVQAGLSEDEAAAIEARYREDLVAELEWHDFRGIVQVKRDMRLPLADIYQELGLLRLDSEQERREAQDRLLAMRQEDRVAEEERRLEQRVSDALARSPRLVVLGEPGAGKTLSLHFATLMLAHGYGAARLGLDAPYIPLLVRLADYARELEKNAALGLDSYLLAYVERAYVHPRLGEYMRQALDRGACMVLLDGLDEVGDDVTRGHSRRVRLIRQVQRFADRWCADQRSGPRCNRIVLTSRIEGYWDEPVAGFDHVQLSPLRPPDEIEAFLLRWYTAHEVSHGADEALAETHARARVGELLPRVLQWPSVRRLATNPLLLTILALIHENVGRLPNRRIRLYEICAQTLIESWRQAQTGMPSELLADLGEETMIRVMAPLAYWLHEEHPGGTASYEEWRERLIKVLVREGFEQEAREIAGRFLHHARHETGLLAERGLGQYGFFHLTFEEYLAARQMARQRADERRELLRARWEDPRWHEVILLAAGQLGIVEARRDDASDFVEDLLQMEPRDREGAGRQVVLAGRALADVGPRSVTPQTRRWVLRALQETMQDCDPDAGRPRDPPLLPVRTRYDAGQALDELGWLPEDLDAWVLCPGCAEGGGDLLVQRYPVTNAQYARFVQDGGYENAEWWSEEGWRWRVKNHPSYRGDEAVTEPEYWHNPRFGQDRQGYPAVGVSWYEAHAFCRWLQHELELEGRVPVRKAGQLESLSLSPGALSIRLPTDDEWTALAGGLEDEKRYPWDSPGGSVTVEERGVLARANASESELGGTSPVGMYPLGASQPFGLMDLAGNVWEWMDSQSASVRLARWLRGGSWGSRWAACGVGARYDANEFYSVDYLGFRCVSPISLS